MLTRKDKFNHKANELASLIAFRAIAISAGVMVFFSLLSVFTNWELIMSVFGG